MATSNLLLGIEADISGSGLSASTTTVAVGGGFTASPAWSDRVDLFGTARGRIGVVAGNWVFYGTGGFAWAADEFTRAQLTSGPLSPPVGFAAANNATRTGWTAGGGIEWGFAPGWSAKLEYLYLNLGTETFAFSAPTAAGGTRSWSVAEGDMTIHTVRLGVNYRFDWSGPVAAGQ
jgi:outer membrane immunogenic protein